MVRQAGARMSPMLALWASIVLGGCAQVMLRKGVRGGHAQSPRWWLNLLSSGWVLGWGICFMAGTMLWMVALSHMDISYAFPLVSASYVLVAVLSRLLLKESIPWQRWLAIAVISLGVALSAGN
jgi:drug/metabolite transporter (DMT)-like permease